MGCLCNKLKSEEVAICGTLKNFEKECLDEHNNLRAMHGCPPLNEDHTLKELAQDWAKHLIKTNVMEHRPNSKYGENIFWAYNIPIDGATAVKSWYDECRLYDFHNPVYSPETGHFTQIVWKNTKSIGMGVARQGPMIWVVVNYDPVGNIQGKFDQNVPLPLYKGIV